MNPIGDREFRLGICSIGEMNSIGEFDFVDCVEEINSYQKFIGRAKEVSAVCWGNNQTSSFIRGPLGEDAPVKLSIRGMEMNCWKFPQFLSDLHIRLAGKYISIEGELVKIALQRQFHGYFYVGICR